MHTPVHTPSVEDISYLYLAGTLRRALRRQVGRLWLLQSEVLKSELH